EDLSIRELAQLVCQVLQFDCELVFDSSKPDGTPQKRLDVRRIHALGWHATTTLAEGILQTYEAMRTTLETTCTGA
ncbi:MAG TPA: GDP-L-fucose synthase, partial [Acidobacteriaceae bacterium]